MNQTKNTRYNKTIPSFITSFLLYLSLLSSCLCFSIAASNNDALNFRPRKLTQTQPRLASSLASSTRGRRQTYSNAKIKSKLSFGIRGGGETDLTNNQNFKDTPDIKNDYGEEEFFSCENPPRPFIEMPETSDIPKVGLILMDGFCPFHGQYLSYMARTAYKVGVVNVLSGYITRGLTEESQDDDDNDKEEEYSPDYASMRTPDIGHELEWAQQILFPVVGIICESDSGLPSAERLGVALGLDRHDGINRARRDKYLMNQAMRNHGLYTVSQKLCSSVEEAIEFAESVCQMDKETTENEDGHSKPTPKPRPCVVIKPTRGVASDNVHLCATESEIREAYDKIHQTPIFGSPSNSYSHVLVQEFARGTEYAIDIVSKNGQHKIAALWKYDKRSVNGAPFVYHATMLEDATESKEGMEACCYAMEALDALNCKWGLSHIEVMVNVEEGKTCLIEVNCRQHNTDFAPMTSLCIGYNALDMLLSAYLGDYYVENSGHNEVLSFMGEQEEQQDVGIRLDWDLLPVYPSNRAFGAIIHLVCHAEGTVIEVKGLEELESLESVRNYEIYESFLEGNEVSKTIDIRTDAGWVHLINDDQDEFWRDYNRIMELMEDMFVVED